MAVLFVVIVVFNGGVRRDCVMIPVSSNCAGSYLFQKELGNFLSGAEPAILTGVASDIVGGDGLLAGGA
nr:hypothetical protein CFP56_46135 [Quercus suber]POF10701.1 hypothetical protein CFP56_46136 [Quercus suber]